jgi:RNA polymerase sigma-70 factor (ECF subfamily)
MSNPDSTSSCDAGTPDVRGLLERAKSGDEEALRPLVQWSRDFLRREAQDVLAPPLRVRMDESDLVQKVCLAAYQQFGQFRGSSEAEYVQWLRRILERDILEVVEREREAAKRAVDREVPGSEPLRRADLTQSASDAR